MRSVVVILMVLASLGSSLTGQSRGSGRSGDRPLLPRDLEIALARSAAPPSVSATARIYVLTPSGYEVADSGRSRAACYVSRSWPASLEPHCFDAEGAVSILPMEMRRVELLSARRSAEEVERDIADGLIAGRFRLPTRPATSYMMSCAQQLISDDGEPAGKWRAHLMIYFPYLTEESVGFTDGPDIRAIIVVDPETPESNLMIPVNDFIKAESPAVCSP